MRGLPAFLLLLALGTSCALGGPGFPQLPGGDGDVAGVEIADVPFFPQGEKRCGPASLATVLAYAGIDTSPADLADEVFLPGRGGSLQIEMAAAVRRRGLIPSPVRPEMAALLQELHAGRPVLVLQDLGAVGRRLWHYAVVVGYDQTEDAVVLRSGRKRREVMDAALFARTWEPSGKWGFVVLPPGEIPAAAERRGYLSAVAALEETGRPGAAEKGYRAALLLWPRDETALLGIGNALLRQHDQEGAERAYRRLLAAHPGSLAGRNNLAHLLMEAGRLEEAEEEIARGLEAAREQGATPPFLLETESEIRDRRRGPAP